MPLDATSSTRDALAELNRQLAGAARVRDETQRAHDRFLVPARLLAEATAEYAAEKSHHDASIISWYESNCPGARPEPTTRMLELERKLGDLRRDIDISDGALQSAAAALQEANVSDTNRQYTRPPWRLRTSVCTRGQSRR